jgi:hypothetical protein
MENSLETLRIFATFTILGTGQNSWQALKFSKYSIKNWGCPTSTIGCASYLLTRPEVD